MSKITLKSISTLHTLLMQFGAMCNTDCGDNAANGMVTLAPMVMDASLLTAMFLAKHIWPLAEATAPIRLSQVANTPAFAGPGGFLAGCRALITITALLCEPGDLLRFVSPLTR